MAYTSGGVVFFFKCSLSNFGLLGLTVGKCGISSEVLAFFVLTLSPSVVFHLEALTPSHHLTLSSGSAMSSFICNSYTVALCGLNI